ncbi:hypothetical protein RHGRI_038483 [Rhododendron griersonianum]|uniref:Uncharacterized protein n=1 Tax=Rhododendron griersonianum TaxID=479676 RepID=A0AAV6HM16_9ERIC|nr:hypothetical protein RHGRI_038483 [Rhododendron griersonianum]
MAGLLCNRILQCCLAPEYRAIRKHACQHSKKLLTLRITSNANNQSKKTRTFMGETYEAEILKDVSEEFKT